MAIIEVENINKEYNDGKNSNHVLKDFSVSIEKGSFVAIIGKSGAGKSTLLNIMGGLDRADSGNVIINGKRIDCLNDKEMSKFRADEIGFVFQNFNLIPVLTVIDNILLPVRIAKESVDMEYIDDIIKMLEIDEKRESLPDELSGGQKQRVAIARALANKPSIILADEPTGNLDEETGNHVLELLTQGIKKYNQTLIVVTHDMDIATKADTVIRING